ncbi:3-hydroxyacyl-CoA dehydrogenase NAD-binding domain-containing protein [Bacillus horti]|uniref:3-hydroxybutyryl-CoA dehydrogenase n=1 Tax=Caldalkalibacillus horti TaxID=77523 RepID=A0ABT9W0C0_9BACI|nr:3-hydroxyacyl-CoA dehydrogenase NAD-binding domain-containing protein [Bacillus horti]MDQ0166704.1 3-hydroxybutyryl-CoA dehydrogenase [Bacillus horti]
MLKQKHEVMIIGAGTMGRGIAQVFLQGEMVVTLIDSSPSVLEQAKQEIGQRLKRLEEKNKLSSPAIQLMERLSCSEQIEGHKATLIIEAIIENIDAKKQLFIKLDQCYPAPVILATNTSSFSISEMAASLSQPKRMLGMHFFNPAPLMPLVEVIAGIDTDEATLEQATELLRSIEKEPIGVKDSPGFIVNRVARPFYTEGLKMLGEGIADVTQIDEIMKDAGFPMGPFELQDLIGIDINFATTCTIYEAYFQHPRFRPHPLQKQMVKSNRLGRKTGRGFYVYD